MSYMCRRDKIYPPMKRLGSPWIRSSDMNNNNASFAYELNQCTVAISGGESARLATILECCSLSFTGCMEVSILEMG